MSLLAKGDTQKIPLFLLLLSQLGVMTGTVAAILQPWEQARILSSMNPGPYLALTWVPDPASCYKWYIFLLSQLNQGFSFSCCPKPDWLSKTPINSRITIKMLVLRVMKPGTNSTNHVKCPGHGTWSWRFYNRRYGHKQKRVLQGTHRALK